MRTAWNSPIASRGFCSRPAADAHREVQAELTARKAAREKSTRPSLENPRAKQALATPAARAQRDKSAKDRA
jgi:hypothetical protein